MGKYELQSKWLSDNVEIYIVEDLSGGGVMGTIVYESPGSNGGIIIGTGRMNETLVINGKILSKYKFPTTIEVIQDDINNKSAELQDIRDNGYPVTIRGNLPINKTGEYIITEFTWNKPIGQLKYIGFTMTLQEYRQTNVKQNEINLIGAEVVRNMKDRKDERATGL